MRNLNIVPIVHSTHDLGQLKDSILAGKTFLSANRFAETGHHTADWFWEELQDAIRSWNWNFQNIYLYQDALPVGQDESGQLEKRIVADLAAKGNPNYVTLRWLIESGANLIGTEDPALLLEEYRLVQKMMATNAECAALNPIDTERLLQKRDHFIAARVNQTLPEGGTGLLFLGMLHRVENDLPSNIQVSYPFGKPATESITVRKTY